MPVSHCSPAPSALRRSLTMPLEQLRDALPAVLHEDADLRAMLPAGPEACWTIGGLGLIGFGRAASFAITGEDRFTGARAWWDDVVDGLRIEDPLQRSATGPVAFGAFAFARSSQRRSGLVVPELVLGRDGDGAWATLVSSSPDPLGPDDIAEAVRRLIQLPDGPAPETAAPRALEDPAAQAAWLDGVASGIEEIRSGSLEKIVLARRVPVRAAEGSQLDMPRALSRLAADYDRCWTYTVDILGRPSPDGGRAFGATPERLVRVLDGAVHARVLAGTVARASSGPASAAERAWAHERLMEDAKQRSEHEFAIASFLEGIAAYTDAVRSSTEPYLLELPNVWHLASDVTCDLRRGPDGTVASALELVEAVHPTAAVCGTPTAAAAASIARLEGMDRGLYAGPVGWVDARHNGDFGIALRGGILEDAATAGVYAGCGIVGASDPAEELAETRAKLRPVLGALGAE
ncbi:isochorismate synthase MenF [Kocuria palustris]|uniref:isochorismate synthase n=1 Tax=Kocuria palustris TaxID=71999 RepID=UPI00077B7686|nr:isochorismate synthase [Kocuria palustris]